MMRSPAILSVTGVAAAIAVTVVLLFPWNGTPTVQAAMIMQKLNEQIEQAQVIEVTLEALHIDEVFVEGRLQVSDEAVAGNMIVEVQEGDADETINVDLSLAVSDGNSWVLIRELHVPDPEIQPLVNLIFPPGSETLLLLPTDEATVDLDLDLDEHLEAFQSGEMMDVIKGLIDAHDEFGATLEYQDDGTILLTLPIEDAEALRALQQLTETNLGRGQTITISAGASGASDEPAEIVDTTEAAGETRTIIHGDTKIVIEETQSTEHASVDDHDELIGTTLTVVYDPVAELVRSFGVYDFGSPGSKIMISIGQGEIDPALLDPESVTTPATRVFDLGALQGMLESLEQATDSAP